MTRFEYQQYGAKQDAVRGNDLPQAKLDADKVREIRRNIAGETQAQLASRFHVHRRTIEKVHAYETWAHV